MKQHPLYHMATPEQKKILDEQYDEKLKELEKKKEERIQMLIEQPYRSDSFKGFIQHIPNMVSGVDPEYLETDKWEDVLTIDCVKRFMVTNKPAISLRGNTPTLMVLSDMNKDTNKYRHWWVVGFLKGFTPDEIPLNEYENMIEQ